MSASKITFAYLYPQSYQSLSIGKTTQASTALDVSGDVNIDSGLLYVDGSNNRVGINRTNPSYTLDVNGNLNFTGSLFQNGSTFSGATQWTTSGNNIYYQAGNVGIGKTNPSVALDVSGDVQVNGRLINVPYRIEYLTATGTSFSTSTIPNNIEMIQVVIHGLVVNGSNPPTIRLATSSGTVSSGYTCVYDQFNTTPSVTTNSTGIILTEDTTSSTILYGHVWLYRRGNTNTWTFVGSGVQGGLAFTGGSVTLSSALTQLVFTTTGSIPYTAGNVSIYGYYR